MKVHLGMTTCPRCQKVFGTVNVMRRHQMQVHSMSHEQVRGIVPTRPKWPAMQDYMRGGQ